MKLQFFAGLAEPRLAVTTALMKLRLPVNSKAGASKTHLYAATKCRQEAPTMRRCWSRPSQRLLATSRHFSVHFKRKIKEITPLRPKKGMAPKLGATNAPVEEATPSGERMRVLRLDQLP